MLGSLFFLIYINDLIDSLHCDVKLFADDISLFTLVHNEIVSTQFMNQDLEKLYYGQGNRKCISMQAFQCRPFNE